MDIDYLKRELRLGLSDLSHGRRAISEGRMTAADTFARAAFTKVSDLLDWLERAPSSPPDQSATGSRRPGGEDVHDHHPVHDDDEPPEDEGRGDPCDEPE